MGNRLPVKTVQTRPRFGVHAIAPPNDPEGAPNDRNLTFTLVLTDPDALSYKKPTKSEMCHWIVTNMTTPMETVESAVDGLWNQGVDLLEKLLDVEDAHDPKKKKKQHDHKLVNEIESYYPPAPPKKTGPHRYVFVLLEGDAVGLSTPKERPHWGYGKERHGVRQWAAENNLTVVGANFFTAQDKKQKKHKKHSLIEPVNWDL
ncbi:hypothetical protein BT93_L5614 [Corymbia citriodora subsp. variegata]|uniref:PEBP-like protein n=1 Tax=Corymbia citriodora subsp. variegata TaxID=360336 RepID=A0A8T0CIR6_CORYI|nr:hypothetical protein BT93_L5614 [Corymbia citriodora subsp. variegata]